MGIFSKLFVAVMAHIIMENADEKNKVTYYLFSIKNHEYTFVIFFMGQSLFVILNIIRLYYLDEFERYLLKSRIYSLIILLYC